MCTKQWICAYGLALVKLAEQSHRAKNKEQKMKENWHCTLLWPPCAGHYLGKKYVSPLSYALLYYYTRELVNAQIVDFLLWQQCGCILVCHN